MGTNQSGVVQVGDPGDAWSGRGYLYGTRPAGRQAVVPRSEGRDSVRLRRAARSAPRTESQPAVRVDSSLLRTFADTLLLGPSPLATATATFGPTASTISATSLCVNPGQSRTE